jgi:UDP-glucose 6-dehydrogenase
VFEPGLEDLVNSLRGKNLVFTSSLEQTVTESQVQGAGCRV